MGRLLYSALPNCSDETAKTKAKIKRLVVVGDRVLMSRRTTEMIEKLEPTVEALGYELVDVEYNPSAKHGLLRLYIDGPEGVTVEDCARVSHQVSGIMDVEDTIPGEYNLEVSSPGLDRILRTHKHYEQHLGLEVALRTKRAVSGRRKFTGLLAKAVDEQITLQVDGELVTFDLDNIEKTRLVPVFET